MVLILDVDCLLSTPSGRGRWPCRLGAKATLRLRQATVLYSPMALNLANAFQAPGVCSVLRKFSGCQGPHPIPVRPRSLQKQHNMWGTNGHCPLRHRTPVHAATPRHAIIPREDAAPAGLVSSFKYKQGQGGPGGSGHPGSETQTPGPRKPRRCLCLFSAEMSLSRFLSLEPKQQKFSEKLLPFVIWSHA